MIFISFQVYESHRVKSFKYFASDSLLITMSTEGFVTVWQVDFLTSLLKEVTGDIELTEKVEPLYNFEIESRLISMDCKLERKKAKQTSPEDEAVVLTSTTAAKNKGLINRIIQKKKTTRIGARGGRRGAKGLARLKKYNFLGRLGLHRQAKQHQADTEDQ